MDKDHNGFDHGGMKRALHPQRRKQPAPVFIAEWLTYLGVKPVELVKADVLSEGYLSLLRSGKRINPSTDKLIRIGDFLGITWTDLYRQPPPGQVRDALRTFSPKTIERLQRPKMPDSTDE